MAVIISLAHSKALMAKIEDSVIKIRKQAIAINRTFAELTPMLDRIHLMSFNAKLASHRLGGEGMSFSVIVTEVRALAVELRELIIEAEKDLLQVVNELASVVKSENYLNLFQKSIDFLISDGNGSDGEAIRPEPYRWQAAMEPGVVAQWRKLQDKTDVASPEHLIWEKIIVSRTTIKNNFLNLDLLAGHLMALMERIDRVASRKSDFLAITSMIESARVVDKDSGLSTVSEKLRILAGDISRAEEKASSQAASFKVSTSSVAAILKSE